MRRMAPILEWRKAKTMLSNVYQHRYEHLREIIERHGGQSAVAEKLEVTKQYLGTIGAENPKKNIGHKMARKIETVFGLPIGTLDSPSGASASSADDYSVTVPLLNVVASMGHGATMDWEEETVQEVRFSKRWLRHNTEASSFSTLAVITARGDSMSPTFTDGSILLVDTSHTQAKIDGVYVLRRDDELFIKRIQRNLDGTLDVISDNPQYKVQVLANPIKSGILVLGRVLLAMNMHKL